MTLPPSPNPTALLGTLHYRICKISGLDDPRRPNRSILSPYAWWSLPWKHHGAFNATALLPKVAVTICGPTTRHDRTLVEQLPAPYTEHITSHVNGRLHCAYARAQQERWPERESERMD